MSSQSCARSEELECGVIEADRAVRLRFWAHDRENGELLQYGEDLCYLHGGYGGVFPEVELRLDGCAVHERIKVDLTPEQSYGHHDPGRVIVRPKRTMPEAAQEVGTVLDGKLPDGSELPFIVTTVDENNITLDGNHPWAGRHLSFTFEVMEIRDSISAEREAGFPF